MGRQNFQISALPKTYEESPAQKSEEDAEAAAPSELRRWARWQSFRGQQGDEEKAKVHWSTQRNLGHCLRVAGREPGILRTVPSWDTGKNVSTPDDSSDGPVDHWSQQQWWAFSHPSVMSLRLYAATAPEPRQQKEGNDRKAHRRTARKWDFRLFPS